MAKTNTLFRSEQERSNAAAHLAKAKQADMDKMMRLRALRLEKEAADKEAAAAAPPITPSPRKRALARPAKPAPSGGTI